MIAAVATSRARAAWAYSRLDQRALAETSGVSYERLRVILTGTTPDVKLEELYAIADAADVPRWFMERGFGSGDRDLPRRVGDLLEQHAFRITEVERALGQERGAGLVAWRLHAAREDALRQPPGELGRDARGETPTNFDGSQAECSPSYPAGAAGPTVGYCSKCDEARETFYTCRDGGSTVPKNQAPSNQQEVNDD